MTYNTEVIKSAVDAFGCTTACIKDVSAYKKGMTNRSFTFTYKHKRYIMRMPGEGANTMVDRKKEHSVYRAVASLNICDEVVYFNTDNGCKISVYLEGVRACNPLDMNDVRACMKKLSAFHQLKIKTPHSFDIFERIAFYERLWPVPTSCFSDYKNTKDKVMQLKKYLDSVEREQHLTHIDANPDNFLLSKCGKKIQLVDWEYAATQDPHVDIAMFAIYSLYEKKQVDALINSYFENKCPASVRVKIYAYIAVCGLLWSNWCEYKRQLGIDLGEYSLRQYRYAKEYFSIFTEAHSSY